MKLSEISIRNHVFAWMLMFSLIIFGGICYKKMGISQLPNVDFPTVNINVGLEGASPEIIELDIVDVIEGALVSIPGIKGISSSSRTGAGNISVEFELDKDIDIAVSEIQSAISRVQRRLPSDVTAPTVRKSNPDDMPILWIAIASNDYTRKELMEYVRDNVQDSFSMIEGVGEVFLAGYVTPNLRVWLSQEKMDQFQLTASDIVSAISREHSEMPGGRIETAKEEINIRATGEATNLNDFENITITRRGGSLNYIPVALKDIAKVEDGTEDIRNIARSNGQLSVGLGIKKQPGANAIEVAKKVKEKMIEVQKILPKGIDMGVRFDSTQFIKESVDELVFTLIFAALLTGIICWIFLGSFSATLNIILAIPTSIIGSFIILYTLDYTLNTFTLLALSLAIGIVVDDAIMVLENIVRHLENGKNRMLAALDGSSEITLAAMATTAAIIAIFFPVAFMDGVMGRFFLQFGVTLSVAVAISLLEALTLTPMRCSRFLQIGKRNSLIGRLVESFFQKSSEIYRKFIPITLKRPWLTILLASVFFVLTLLVGGLLKKEFVPTQDQAQLSVRIQTKVGSSLAFTDMKVKEVEKYFSEKKEVLSYFSAVGGMGGHAQVNSGNIFLTLNPKNQRELNAQELAKIYRSELKNIKGVRATISDPSLSALGGRRSYPIQFTIRGADWEKLASLSEAIIKKMEETNIMMDVDSNYQSGMPEVRIIPDRMKARQYGVDVQEITKIVNIMMSGTVAGKYSEGGRRYDIRVGLPPDSKNSLDTVSKLKVRNNQGELIPLEKVVKIEKREGLQSISREDRQRAINITANVAAHSSQAEAMKKVETLLKEIMPQGYSFVFSGSAKTFQESFGGLVMALLLGILISYMVLASQFNSFIHPITILSALPFSVSGAFIALYLGEQTLNIYSMIGLILLMGIVKKNSIMLVEFTNQIKRKGKTAREALLEACPIRLRPILMTSISTIVGALPAALAFGPGAESRIPMALSVIGGVIVSTILTLFIVPSIYIFLDRFNRN